MAIAQGYVQNDRGVYFGVQSAKGTQQTTLKGAMSFTKFETTPNKELTNPEAYLGNGIYLPRAVGHSFMVNWTCEGWITLDLFPTFFFSVIGTKGSTTGAGPYTHPYTLITRNINLKYLTILVVQGETSTGTGNQSVMLRDARITAFSFTISGGDAVKFTMSGIALNEGPGAASPTVTFNTGFNIPAPVDATNNTYTYPTAVGFPASFANICVNSITVAWNATSQIGPACLGTGEHSDIFITGASWELTHAMQYDANTIPVYQQINYGTTSPSANTSALIPAIKEGAFSFTISSTTIAGGSTPYSLAMSFPSTQWTEAAFTNATPDVLTVKSRTFSNDATATVVNATAGASMAI